MPLPSAAGPPRSGRPGRIVRRAGFGAGVAVGLVLAAALAVYACWPWLAGALAPRLAPALGLEALAVSSRRPDPGGLRLDRVRVRRGDVELLADGVRLGFGAADLAAGRLSDLTVNTLTVTLRTPAADAGSAAGAPPGDPPRPAELLGALPVDRVAVRRLVVAAPALGFQATGRLDLDDTGLGVVLRAAAPPDVEGLALRAVLGRDGQLAAALVEAADSDQPLERLTLTARVRDEAAGATRLAVDGRLDLGGPTLALLAAAGLPDGIERLQGDLEGSLPWPVPRTLDWSAAAGRGSLTLAGRIEGDGWRVDGAEVDWRVGDGRLAGAVALPVQLGPARWSAALDLAEWRLPGGGAEGTVSVAPVPSESPVADARWRVDAGALILDGAAALSPAVVGPVLDALGVEAAAGAGDLRVTFEGRVDRPLAAPAPALQGTVSGHWALPASGPAFRAIEGTWRVDGRAVSGRLQASAAWRDLGAPLAIDLAEAVLGDGALAARGSVTVGGHGPLAFDLADGPERSRLHVAGSLDAGPALLRDTLTGWTAEADLTAGRIGLDLDLAWPDVTAEGSRITVDLDEVSAYYGEYVAEAVSASLTLHAGDSGWHLPPTPVTARRIATGVPLTELRSGVAWSGDVLRVLPTTAEVLGGTATLPAFDYDLAAGLARFPLTLDGLDLARVLELEGEQISGSGRIGGTLPVALDDHRPSVSGGVLRAEPPGGRLRVSPALAGGTGQPGLDFALRALQDFRFDVLEADVDYDVDGNLALAVHLQGRNPAIEGGRPIHYNVNVTENLPVLLRSLRLEREVTRSVERRLNN